jgi:formylglycine-generating enzyme required for sulfatase activity
VSTTADNDLYRGSYPVMRVARAQARIYAAWAGGSLPTEAQWLRAYRGDDGQTYPWAIRRPTRFNHNAGTTRSVWRH